MRFGAKLRARQEQMRTHVRPERRMWRKRRVADDIAEVYEADLHPLGFVGFRDSYRRAMRRFCGEPDTLQRFWWAR